MKGVLLNENLPARLSSVLSTAGIFATHVCEVELNGRPDSEVLSYALVANLAVLTKDSDYLDLILARKEGKVILVRIGNARLGELVAHIRSQCASIATFLESEERVLII